nr:thioredoxin domain-containing protein [Pseudopedobacter sp.]
MTNTKLDPITATTINFSNYFGFDAVTQLQEKLLQHPYYPSLLSISEVLENEAGIKNFAVKIQSDQLHEVNLPCMAHLNTKGGEYVLITEVKADKIFYELEGKKRQISFADFEKIWTGVVLVSEVQKQELKQKLNYKVLIPYLVPLFSIALIGILFFKSLTITLFSPILFTGQFICLVAGLSISVMLLIQSLGRSNSFIQQLCGSESKHNCNHILSSQAAHLTSWFSLSDLGFLYFSGSLLILFLSHDSTAAVAILTLNVLALPFTFWSVYYQWKIARTWCRLCLMIQGLFWLQALFSFFTLYKYPALFSVFNFYQIPLLLIVFLFPSVVWLSSKDLFKNAQKLVPLQSELNKFKFNVEVFKNQLYSQNQYVGALPKTTIVLGNPDSLLAITMISNPFCNPCAKAHQFLEEWITKGMDFKLNIVYTFRMDENDKQQHFFKHLLAIQQTDIHLVEKALKNWYSQDYQKLDSWKEKYPINVKEEDKLELLEQVNWCKLNEIKGTPTFYINGYQLPKQYQLKDLKYVLMNLE